MSLTEWLQECQIHNNLGRHKNQQLNHHGQMITARQPTRDTLVSATHQLLIQTKHCGLAVKQGKKLFGKKCERMPEVISEF